MFHVLNTAAWISKNRRASNTHELHDKQDQCLFIGTVWLTFGNQLCSRVDLPLTGEAAASSSKDA